jgi:hypothetical protein
MPHPIMFHDDDLGLAELRKIALGFPGAFEKISWGRPVFCAPKIFVMYGDVAKDPLFAQVDGGFGVCQQTS